MPETTAQELREAAKLIREQAEAATKGPWQHMCLGSEGCLVLRASGTVRDRGRGRVARFGQKEWKADHADADFVAGMHPGVALALADWLDNMAGRSEATPDDWYFAIMTARAYLGAKGGGR